MRDTTAYAAVLTALGTHDGYILDWRIAGGCQYVNPGLRKLLTCPFREARWQCEVIGPHKRHRWSGHLMVHERVGNGYSCRSIGDMTLDDLYEGLDPSPVVYHGIGVE